MADHTITIGADYEPSPDDLTVAPDDQITWNNEASTEVTITGLGNVLVGVNGQLTIPAHGSKTYTVNNSPQRVTYNVVAVIAPKTPRSGTIRVT